MDPTRSDKTFGHQHLLPKLPVPRLDETCTRLIEWVQPLLTEAEFNHTRRLVEKFRRHGGDGEKLQNKLVEWVQHTESPNWLEPFWDKKYLKSRTPVPINVNFCTVCENHPSVKKLPQIKRSALLIYLTLRFKSMIDNETLGVDLDKDGPLCMIQFRKLFSTARIPQRNIDLLRSPISPINPTSAHEKHVIVLHKGHIFSLDVITDTGETKSIDELEAELEHILILGNEKVRDGEAVGWLTTMNRDEWADARDILRNIHPRNKVFIETIESALFVLCLDDFSPEKLDDRFRAALHGDGKNRWFDKSFQFVVSKNGMFAVNGEHSGLDGYPVHSLIRFIYDESGSLENLGNSHYAKHRYHSHKLKFQLNDTIRKTIRNAAKAFRRSIDNTSSRVIEFRKFGKELIKSLKISPDAFIQLALQVALYKMHGKCKSIYEVASTRRFENGRTETLRSVSNESKTFIREMLWPESDTKTTADSLRKAASKHIERMQACMAGKGVERHLFGLLSIYEQFGEDIGIFSEPEIFSDIGWLTLRYDTLSTTSNPDPHGVVLSGFGPVVDDGFGVCYTTTKDRIIITLTSRSNMKESLERFATDLEGALSEMAALMQ